ncbi:MAG: hypothetical protein R3Y24_13750 [Eubacteriales bacterium]
MASYPTGKLFDRNHPNSSGFYIHPCAVIQAKTYYEMGRNLYSDIENRLNNGDNSTETSVKIYPAFVNIAFACEIILKLLYENENGEMAKGHKLYQDLYSKLSSNAQNIISDITINSMKVKGLEDYNLEKFNEELKTSEHTFAHERYIFEYKPNQQHGIRVAFMLSFVETLLRLIMIERESV